MPSRTRGRASRYAAPVERADTRFDRRLGEILEYATDVFYEKGYDGASMRDLSRASGMSLAGLYYYFESKEKLLYLIQKHTFRTVMDSLERRLEGVTDSEQRVRIFIRNHLEYFLANLKAMKVLSHEDEALTGPMAAEIADMKRTYYRRIRGFIDDLRREKSRQGNGVPSRVAAVSLFGMMNWIYTWHNPRFDAGAAVTADQMAEIFLRGVLATASSKSSQAGTPARGSTARNGASPVGGSNGPKTTARTRRTASSSK